MYRINKETNKITQLEQKTFSALGFKETEHLQEWLADNPMALGEELLIIQKEFSGFSDTNERLDLLALDKQGNLVIIENKLDDSGKDVTWQVLKYTSYCSNLAKENIKQIYQSYLNRYSEGENAEEKLSEFLDNQEYEELNLNTGNSQRIIMVAGKFRKEVTSTVLWLMSFNIRIQCFKVTPFAFGEELFLNVEQILPIQDSEELMISMANKSQNELATQETLKSRHVIRLNFWKEFLEESNKKNRLFSNISPSKGHWLGIGIGFSGITLSVSATQSHVRVEIFINKGELPENKKLFDQLLALKPGIEETFGETLEWERKDQSKSSKIKKDYTGVSIFDKEDWPEMIELLIDASSRLEKAFREPVKKLRASYQAQKELQ